MNFLARSTPTTLYGTTSIRATLATRVKGWCASPLVSVSGKTARTCYDKTNQVDPTVPANRVRLLFSYAKADTRPKFQETMTKAIKKLIALTGGAPEKDLF